MKKISEWFNELPEPYKTQANNMTDLPKLDFNSEVNSLMDALNKGFIWTISPEGFHYWEELYNNLKPNNP